MQEIYQLKTAGLTYKQIQAKLKSKISTSGICYALMRYCKKSDLEMPKSKKTGRPEGDFKKYKLKQSRIMRIHAESGRFGDIKKI